MATAINSRSAEIKLEYGKAEQFALKFVNGKNFDGAWGPRVLFTAVDGRKLWLDAEDGSQLERALVELNVQPADFIRVTKTRHPKGGHSLTVEKVRDQKTTDQKTTETATEAAPVKAASAPSGEKKENGGSRSHPSDVLQQQQPNGSAERAAITPAAAKMCAAFLVAIDAVSEAQTYADRRGLKVTFTSEDVRACAISAFIQGGR